MAWPMGGPDPSAPPEFGFDQALEPIIPERALLLDVGADFRELLIADRFVEERAVGDAALGDVWPQGQVDGMGMDERVVPASRIGVVARPGMLRRRCHHRCPYGIELDIAIAAKQVGFRVDEAGLVAALPQRAAAAVSRIEGRDICSPQFSHHARDSPCGFRRNQQVHVVAHQHIGVDPAAVARSGLTQHPSISAAVVIIEEARHPIVAPLDDMLWNARKIGSWESSHAARIAGRGIRSQRRSR